MALMRIGEFAKEIGVSVQRLRDLLCSISILVITSESVIIMLEVILMALMRIGEFAKEIGVSVQRLRDLDKNGTLKPAAVSPKGTRYYSDEQLYQYTHQNQPHRKIGVSVQRLRDLDKNGTLKPAAVSPKGTRYYSDEQLYQYTHQNQPHRKVVGYCRVSTNRQKEDLETQISNVKTYMIANGYSFEVISDIGSGIDYKKKGLQKSAPTGRRKIWKPRSRM